MDADGNGMGVEDEERFLKMALSKMIIVLTLSKRHSASSTKSYLR